jgi:carbamate kinase
MSTYVIAIGGNALEDNQDNIGAILNHISECIVKLIKNNNKIILVHGNGPQIGKIVIQNHCAHNIIKESSIDECGAMTQALIGYQLQKELGNTLKKSNIKKDIVTVLTQVIVDENEVLTIEPTKPIGPFFTKEEVQKLMNEENVPYIEDSARGYRRVVPSPMPRKIEEIAVIKKLLDDGNIVIAGGGGGIPVIVKECELKGVDAVIDKDYTAQLIASEIEADYLVILTGVEYVAINYGKDDQTNLKKISISQLDKYIQEGQFSKGSMLPKVSACKMFVENRKNRMAVIGTISKLRDIISGTSGTVIYN